MSHEARVVAQTPRRDHDLGGSIDELRSLCPVNRNGLRMDTLRAQDRLACSHPVCPPGLS